MKKYKIKFGFYLIFCFMFHFGLSLSSLAVGGNADSRAQTLSTTSSKSFSFNDVYRLSVQLNSPGSVRIIAIDSKVENKSKINVKLEKQVTEYHPILTKSQLDSITLVGINEDGTLQLGSNISEVAFVDGNSDPRPHPEPFDVKKHIVLNYIIETPPDISIKLSLIDGKTYVHHLRGDIEITSEAGDVHLDETLGNYQIEVKKGLIHGNILLAPGQSDIKTHHGAIHLTFLDPLSAPLNLTSLGGGIKLFLPNNYAADLALKSEKEHYIINFPAEINNSQGTLNGGGPLLSLTATDTIAVVPHPTLQNSSTKSSESGTTPDKTLTDAGGNSDARPQPVPLSTIAPMIDGNLFEKAWLTAEPLTDFLDPAGNEKAANSTEVFLMWDANYLYIGGRAYFSSFQVPRVSQTQHDSPIWEDESVEILLDMDPETEGYSHLVVNPINAVFDQWVEKVGYPTNRFFPEDVPRESKDESVQQFRSDISWNSEAKVATQIKTNFWSFEIAYPHTLTLNSQKEGWLLNVHRKAQGKLNHETDVEPTVQREYSYWLPVYDEDFPWWPHWIEGMGRLKLLKAQPSTHNLTDSATKDSLKTFDNSETFEVSTLEIEGNTTVPTEEVRKHIPIDSGDMLSNQQLAWLIAELKNMDWFQEVQLKTVLLNSEAIGLPETSTVHRAEARNSTNTQLPDVDSEIEPKQTDKPLKVLLQINFTEAAMQHAKKISIDGNKHFPAHFIKKWFDVSVGYVPKTNAALKQQMVRDFYLNRGFPFAEVTHAFVHESWQLDINEGYLDEIRFTGNRRIPAGELISALDMSLESVYFHSLGQSKINQLHQKLRKNNSDFKSIQNWHVQQEGGRNILLVQIQEQPNFKHGWVPIVGFNRVHGVALGANGNIVTHWLGQEQFYGSLSFGFSSKIWNYHFGVEKRFFQHFPFGIGIGFYKLTDTSSNDYRLLPTETNLSAAVYGSTFEDYYERQGQHIWLAQWFGKSSLLRLEWTQEHHNNLFKSTDWSYFNRSLLKRGNMRIGTGRIKMLSLGWTYDTRDHKSTLARLQSVGSRLLPGPNERTRRGWRGHFGIEAAGGPLGGEYTFTLYKFEVVRYTPIVGASNLNVRVSGDFSDSALPTQHLFYLGGATTLRGYNFNRFAGDKRILFNLEYRIADEIQPDPNSDMVYGWGLSAFLDVGQVWWFNENPFSNFSLNQLKASIGLGAAFFIDPPGQRQPLSTAIEIALPLNSGESITKPVIILRLERMF